MKESHCVYGAQVEHNTLKGDHEALKAEHLNVLRKFGALEADMIHNDKVS